jgi:methyl-accepting chemotaxis protein
MDLGKLFGRLKIGTRVYAGFGLTLVLLIAVGAVGVLNLGKTGTALEKYDTISTNTVSGVGIERNFVGLRRNILAYTTSGNERALARARELGPALQKEMTALIDALIVAERKAQLQTVKPLVDQYVARIDEVAKLRGVREKAVAERMNPVGAKARAEITDIIKSVIADGDNEAAAVAGQVQEALMLARINALRFLVQPDQKLVETFKQQAATFDRAVTDLQGRLRNPERKRLAADAADLGRRYAQAFDEVAKATFELETMVNRTMADIADKVSVGLGDYVKAQREGLASINKETHAAVDQATTMMIVLAIAAVVLGLLIAFLIARSIVKPVVGLVEAMKKLATGDFSVVLPGLGRKDEVGQMAEAVEEFKIKAAEKAQREAEEKEEADRKLAAERKEAMLQLANAFEQAVGGIVETVSSASTELEAAAGTLTKTAETTQSLSATVAAASEEASTNVQSVASATNEMSSSVNEISRQVQESAKIANEAVKQAEKTDGRITELSQAASRIGDVVKLITAIAEQTNLLALNATIEAARAGEAGKGFAVVAQEVKALAAQTGKATGEIGSQISGMQAATQESVSAIKEIGGTIGRIAEIASTIAAAVEEQGAATQEIARNVQQAAQGTTQVASNITEVNRGAGETGSASSQVLSSAQSLAGESNRLKLEVAKFLTTVRSA